MAWLSSMKPGQGITESSVGAYLFNKNEWSFDYEIAVLQYIIGKSPDSIKANNSWPEAWNFPVCYIGDNNWHSRLNESSTQWLPCCCGQNCEETKTFSTQMRFDKSKLFVEGCRKQLGGTSIDFNSIDYGFSAGSWTRPSMLVAVA